MGRCGDRINPWLSDGGSPICTRNHKVHPSPVFSAIDSIKRPGAGLNHKAHERDDRNPFERTFVESIQVIDEELPKCHPESSQRPYIFNSETRSLEEILDSIPRVAIIVSGSFMDMPYEWHSVDREPALAENTTCLPKRGCRILEVFQDSGT